MIRRQAARGKGRDAWYGWPTDPALEGLRVSWLQKAPYLPLGQILQPTVYRTSLSGILPGFAKFWPVRAG